MERLRTSGSGRPGSRIGLRHPRRSTHVCAQGNPDRPLDEREQGRLDALLSSAKHLHYASFIISALSLALSTTKAEGLTVPLGNVALPRLHAILAAFLLTTALAIASDRLFRLARPSLGLDPRRPPFAWLALSPHSTNRSVLLWLLLPMAISSVAAAIALGSEAANVVFMFTGFALVGVVPISEKYISHLKDRSDERGGQATLSIWLLYWLRLLRQLSFTAFLFFPVLAVIDPWRQRMLTVTAWCMASIAILEGIRLVGNYVYKPIDRLGSRLGFARDNPHAHKPHRPAP